MPEATITSSPSPAASQPQGPEPGALGVSRLPAAEAT